ncbi:FtsX-like permease family protein [uncultured Sphaerochaeta sp.]|uniref:ABC transporter permease n=1 Tax=uncultured Sphaerochaeta sp. TaxID=886478 RepID=UPI002A0A8CAF|nr:FtsX-like permease family protein [uncultured Sphaerochaeta sp.]
MNLLKIAYRNVSRQKRRSNLLALAIAFGVMMIILVNSLTQGLVQNTEKNFESALGGHIYLTGEVKLDSGKIANQISDPQILDAVIPQFSDYIADFQKRSTISGDFIFHSKSTTSILYGVHWDAEQSLIDSMEVVAGSLDRLGEKEAIVLPQEVANKLGVEVNEGILISFSTVTGQANVGEFTVVAITKDTMGLGFAFAYADIGYVNELVGLAPCEYQSYNLTLKDIALINPVSAKIKQALIDQGANLKPVESESDSLMSQGGMASAMFGSDKKEETWIGTRFNVGNLNDYMDMVQQIVSILNGVALGVFLIMLLITMVGLMNTFRMIMIERTREIGTMRAIGMQRKDVSKLFLLEGAILALRGIFYGVIAELVVATILHMIRFADGSSFAIILNHGHIAVPFVFSSILTITLIILFITLIAVLSPARKAAKLQPAEALRS